MERNFFLHKILLKVKSIDMDLEKAESVSWWMLMYVEKQVASSGGCMCVFVYLFICICVFVYLCICDMYLAVCEPLSWWMLMDSEKKVSSSGGQCAGVPKLFAPGPNYPLSGQKYFSMEGGSISLPILSQEDVLMCECREREHSNFLFRCNL